MEPPQLVGHPAGLRQRLRAPPGGDAEGIAHRELPRGPPPRCITRAPASPAADRQGPGLTARGRRARPPPRRAGHPAGSRPRPSTPSSGRAAAWPATTWSSAATASCSRSLSWARRGRWRASSAWRSASACWRMAAITGTATRLGTLPDVALDRFGDDRPGLAECRPAIVEPGLGVGPEVVEVQDRDLGDVPGGGVHVAGHGHVDDHQRPARPGRRRGGELLGGHHRALRARRASPARRPSASSSSKAPRSVGRAAAPGGRTARRPARRCGWPRPRRRRRRRGRRRRSPEPMSPAPSTTTLQPRRLPRTLGGQVDRGVARWRRCRGQRRSRCGPACRSRWPAGTGG